MTITYTGGPAVSDVEYQARADAMANMLTAAPYRHKQKEWGVPKTENECGTTGCVAGWGTLAAKGIVTIEQDGTMTWDPAAMGPYADETDPRWVSDFYGTAPTLWRYSYGNEAHETGRQWLGLDTSAAYMLFRNTADSSLTNQEAIAVELLRRLADGRLSRNFTAADVNLYAMDRAIDARVSREMNAEV